jgi:hypothetical protein
MPDDSNPRFPAPVKKMPRVWAGHGFGVELDPVGGALAAKLLI